MQGPSNRRRSAVANVIAAQLQASHVLILRHRCSERYGTLVRYAIVAQVDALEFRICVYDRQREGLRAVVADARVEEVEIRALRVNEARRLGIIPVKIALSAAPPRHPTRLAATGKERKGHDEAQQHCPSPPSERKRKH